MALRCGIRSSSHGWTQHVRGSSSTTGIGIDDLLAEKGLSSQVLGGLSNVTDRILGLLENPAEGRQVG